MRVELTRAAGRDLDDIYDYTLEHWGEAQAGEYVRALQKACRLLSSDPELGAIADILPGYRKLRHREHLIFYRILTGRIVVSRILHPRMDVSRHLF
ncbi:type II toxin-antitoxin system RelE/ParE family toxin [Sphingomonas sp. MMS12-HWE2-04]|uniref:type II toxin-antitoxin system RelE/ParE family toxin n=1 Tax=Sphingomonas sp. MMS12-HWE2-04 TaxID=3234199 RepID=UPI003850F86A